jgi:hypothetical protein
MWWWFNTYLILQEQLFPKWGQGQVGSKNLKQQVILNWVTRDSIGRWQNN